MTTTKLFGSMMDSAGDPEDWGIAPSALKGISPTGEKGINEN
jgi:hypothetical protein